MDLLVAIAAACLLAKPRSNNGQSRQAALGPGAADPEAPEPKVALLPPPVLTAPEPPEIAGVRDKPALTQTKVVEIVRPMPEFHLCQVDSRGQGAKKRGLAALAGSALVHGALLIAVMNDPAGETPKAKPQYRLQILHLQPPPKPPDKVVAAAAEGLWSAIHPSEVSQSPAIQSPPPSRSSNGQPGQGASRGGIRRKTPAPQTLIVESAPPDLKLKQAIPLPMALSWTALQALPPKQEQVKLETPQAPVPETVRPPDVKVISLPDQVQRAPDAVTLPKVNQSAAQDTQGKDASGPGGTRAASVDAAAAELAKANAAAEEAARAAAEAAANARAAAESAARARAATEAAARSAIANSAGTGASPAPPAPTQQASIQPTAGQSATGQPRSAEPGPVDAGLVRIDQPPGGRARSAILGESPEIPGRIVATIYLRMNLRKNWALEYWSQGNTTALAAPWPLTMFRPNITFPADADALLVRGRLNPEGRLEQLGMLAPTEWAQKDPLFRALEQWKFRAATKNGEAVPVEILLVIPRQPEE